MSSYVDYLETHPEVSLQDFAHTLQERRSTLAHRAFLTASTTEEAAEKMAAQLLMPDGSAGLDTKHVTVSNPRILGVFTGQGAQWARMGAELIETSPFVATRFRGLDEALLSLPLDDRPASTLQEQLLADSANSKISEAAVSQPVCTAVQIVLVDLLRLAGIKFTAVVGHSSGTSISTHFFYILLGTVTYWTSMLITTTRRDCRRVRRRVPYGQRSNPCRLLPGAVFQVRAVTQRAAWCHDGCWGQLGRCFRVLPAQGV